MHNTYAIMQTNNDRGAPEKSTVHFEWLPKPHGKGDGAEAETAACLLAGRAEKIRTAVAEMRSAIRNNNIIK